MVTAQVFLYLWTNTTLMALKTDIVSYWVVVDSQESSSYESDLLLYPQPYRYHQTTAAIIHYIMVRRMAGGGLDEHPGSRLGGSRRKWRAEATHSARSIDIAPLGTSKNGQVHIANKDIRNTRVAITVYCLATRIGMCHCSKVYSSFWARLIPSPIALLIPGSWIVFADFRFRLREALVY